MSSVKQHISQLKDLVATIEEEIAPFLDQADQLEKLKKQLSLLTQRINAMQKSGEEIRTELKAQKIKLALKIDELEEAFTCAYELGQMGSLLTKNYADYKEKDAPPRNQKLINHFNGIVETSYSAFKSERLMKEKINAMNTSDLAKLINAICRLSGDNALYVFNEKIVSKNDLSFHDELFKALNGRFVDVLRFNNANQPKFTLSEFLQYYVNYTLKRDKRFD